MVINFNLMLVWLPMCKYTLTRLASVACRSAQRQRRQLECLADLLNAGDANATKLREATASRYSKQEIKPSDLELGGKRQVEESALLCKLFKWPVRRTILRVRCWLCAAKLNSINSFLVAVDHSTSLHTICATTITVASGKCLLSRLEQVTRRSLQNANIPNNNPFP